MAVRFSAKVLIELCYIGLPVVRTDGRSGGRAFGDVITKLATSGIIRMKLKRKK